MSDLKRWAKNMLSFDTAIAIAENDPSHECFRQIRILETSQGRFTPTLIPRILEIKGTPKAATKSDGRIYITHQHKSRQGLIEVFWLDGNYKIIVFEFTVSDAIWNLAHKITPLPKAPPENKILRDTSKLRLTSIFTKSISTNPNPESPVVAATIIEKKFGRHYLVSTICTDLDDGTVNPLSKFVTQVFTCDENGYVGSFHNPFFHMESNEIQVAKVFHSKAVDRFVKSYF